MSDAFSVILTAVGASSILTTLLLLLAKEWITHRLRKSIEHEYSIKQAAYEAELKRLEVAQGVGTAILSAAHNAVAARQIEALDSLWQHVVGLREAMPPAVTFFDLVMPSHYSEFRTNENLKAAVSDLSFDKLIKEPYKGLAVEKMRPFIGETLYSLYQTYRTFLGRLCAVVIEGRERDEITPWFEDRQIRHLLKAIFTKKEAERLIMIDWPQVLSVRDAIEQKIIAEMELRISGRTASQTALDEAYRLRQAAEQVDADGRRKGVGLNKAAEAP